MYEAFGRGDVAGVLEHVAETMAWEFNGGRSEVPWHAPVAGRLELSRFFEVFGTNVEVAAFVPREFMPSGPHVLVDVHIEYTVRKTGKRVVQDQIHWWTFDEHQRATRMRHFEDTAQVLAAVIS
jgi:hypothetical protein